MGLYGMDSVGMVNFEKRSPQKRKNDPNYNDLLISAQKKAFITRLSIEERARLTDIINNKTLT